MVKRSLRLSVLLLGLAATAQGQLISVKTIPIAQADQFQVFPSRNIGMGGASIALPDTVFDVSSNPAKGARIGEVRFFSAPYLYSASQGSGAGRTLPMGTLLKMGSWFGGFSAALQEVDQAQRGFAGPEFFDVVANPIPLNEGSRGNKFLFGTIGKTLSASGLSVGGSLFWSELHAIDAVDRMYANSRSVQQFGHAVDLRIGGLKEWHGGAALAAVLVHNRFAMTHDVTFADVFWNPVTMTTFQRPRVDRNVDHTNIWGLELTYERPLATPGVRVGAVFTVNRMSHPKIPEYEFTQVLVIPWDPGHTNAFNIGAGISRTVGAATFGADVIFEPIWTHTWGEAQTPLVSRSGTPIPTGGRTVENWFHFTNAVFRMGVDREFWKTANLQLGLNVHTVRYRFWQNDLVQESGRTQTESWTEWAPTWGLRLRFPELEVRYQGSVTNGTGRPGVFGRSNGILEASADGGGSPEGKYCRRRVATSPWGR
jgi:hypothetical protein